MKFATPLIRATLIRRYKRFLADCLLPDGQVVVAHCANTGAMTGLKAEGQTVWLEPNDDPKRKLNFSWKFCEFQDGHYVGIDTSLPNKLVAHALRNNQIAVLSHYSHIRAEAKYGQNSRIDFLLTGDGLPDCYLEVKNVTLKGPEDWAEFPDTVTERGTKHLNELAEMVRQGHRAAMLYLVQRTDCARFRLAPELDPAYATAFQKARAAGVEMLCYDTNITPDEITFGAALSVEP